jgi:hypothetical protein
VASEVVWSDVSFGFDDFACETAAVQLSDKNFAQKVGRNVER